MTHRASRAEPWALSSRIKSCNASNGMTRRLPRRTVRSRPSFACRRSVLREMLVISAASLNETESGYWGSKGNLLRDVGPIVGFTLPFCPFCHNRRKAAAPRKWCSQNPFRDSLEIGRIALVDVGGCWLTLRGHRVLECKCEELVPSQASSGTPTPNLPDPQAGASASSATTAPLFSTS
jgi:hypothetical protein